MSQPFTPLFVDLRDRRVTVTGSGAASLDAAHRLAGQGARVRLVAPELASDGLPGAWELVPAAPAPEHLDGCHLLACGSDDPAADGNIRAAARERGLFSLSLNGDDGDARLGAAAGSDRVQVAASSGACAALDERLAAAAARTLSGSQEALAEICADIREKLEARYPDAQRRAQIWAQVLDSPVLALLEAGDEDEARELAERMAWGTG